MSEKFSDKVIYQIYPKSFCDSNGDGIGDLPGVTSKLDYLKGLGVDYLWLTPFFVSPQRDNGYDIADYRNIEPMFGTMEDLEELIIESDARGLGIMLDMVFNHTSTEHEWFKRALAGDKTYQDYYIFKDGEPDAPPTNWESKFGGSAWEYVPSLKKWYLHLFDVTQADLNWENPMVRSELKDVIKFWKDKGIKGFRFDVVNLISKPAKYENDNEGDGRRFYTDGRHIHEFLKELVADTGIDEMITVGEMSSTSLEHCIRYSSPKEKELSMCFSFHHLKVDYGHGDKWELAQPDYMKLKQIFTKWQEGMLMGGGWNALFWCNHDQPRIVSRFGDDKKNWKESATMLATCIHLMRGTPYIYQGEELGMTNAYYDDITLYRDVESLNYYKILTDSGKTNEEALDILSVRSRDNSRTPMQWNWDVSHGAGFTEGTAWIPIPSYKPEANVEAELDDPDSILNYYKALVEFRKKHSVIAEGDIHFLYGGVSDVMVYVRTEGAEKMVVICNLIGKNVSLPCKLDEDKSELMLHNINAPVTCRDGIFELKPYEAMVYRTH